MVYHANDPNRFRRDVMLPDAEVKIMINATEAIKELLKQRAHDKSRPFCYRDYILFSGMLFSRQCRTGSLTESAPMPLPA